MYLTQFQDFNPQGKHDSSRNSDEDPGQNFV